MALSIIFLVGLGLVEVEDVADCHCNKRLTCAQHTIIVIKQVAEDRSGRARLTVARAFDKICEAYGLELTQSHVLQPFFAFLEGQ